MGTGTVFFPGAFGMIGAADKNRGAAGRAPSPWPWCARAVACGNEALLVALITGVLAIAACAGTDDTTNQTGNDASSGGGITPAEILSLIRQNNDRARSNYELYCAHCPCGAFLDVSAEAEQCQVDVLSDFPDLHEAFVAALRCEIDNADRTAACLEAAGACMEAEACSSGSDAGSGDCEQIIAPQAEAAQQYVSAVQERCGG